MKRRKVTSRPLCLGDLILAVSSYAKSQEETVAAVADLVTMPSEKLRLGVPGISILQARQLSIANLGQPDLIEGVR